MRQHTELIDTAVEPHRTVIRGMMPRTSSLATGAVAGVAAHAAMNAIDPEHKMNRVASEATEGAIAGGIGAGAASALGASAALGPEVLAGASAYIAGSESGRAITNALEQGGASHDTAEAVGSVSGGAIGGVTALPQWLQEPRSLDPWRSVQKLEKHLESLVDRSGWRLVLLQVPRSVPRLAASGTSSRTGEK